MKHLFSDLDLSFEANPSTGDIFRVYDENAIKRSVKSLILTNHYERPFHSEIGTPIRNMLFDNYSPMMVINIRKAIEYLIGHFEPRVELLDVVIDPFEDDRQVDIGVLFRIKNTTSKLAVVVTIDRTR